MYRTDWLFSQHSNPAEQYVGPSQLRPPHCPQCPKRSHRGASAVTTTVVASVGGPGSISEQTKSNGAGISLVTNKKKGARCSWQSPFMPGKAKCAPHFHQYLKKSRRGRLTVVQHAPALNVSPKWDPSTETSTTVHISILITIVIAAYIVLVECLVPAI